LNDVIEIVLVEEIVAKPLSPYFDFLENLPNIPILACSSEVIFDD